MYIINQSFNIDIELQYAIISSDLIRVEQLIHKGANVNHRTSEGQPVLHLAIENDQFFIAQRLLELGANPHAVSMKPGCVGYTSFHFACLKDHKPLMELLIITYNVDLNAVAADGSLPIQFILLNNNSDTLKLLLEKSVSPETRIDRIIFDKFYRTNFQHTNQIYWRGEFGNSITLLTFSILFDLQTSFLILIEYGADIRIKNSENKTLLMVAAFYHRLLIVRHLVTRMNRSEINYVDNEGYAALHHVFIQETRNFCSNQSKGEQSARSYRRSEIVELLIKNGADMNILIRGEPSTLLINMVAYFLDYPLLDYLLPRQKFSPIAKPLCYALMPSSVNYPSVYLPIVRMDDSVWHASYNMSDTIIKDIKLRVAMGYPVLAEEINALNNRNPKYLQDNDCIEVVNQMKYKIISFKNKKLSLYDILKKSDSELQQLAQDNYFLHAFELYYRKAVNDEEKILTMIKVHLDHVSREPLLNKVTRLSFNPDTYFHNISLGCIREIAKYLDVYDLRNFIKAYSQFYC